MRRRFRAAAVLAAIVVVSALLVPAASAQTVEDIEARDSLIAAQEALLNVYRCRFGIDTEIVPGGCIDGVPAEPAAVPGSFTGTPTAAAIEARDGLIAAQEALLNVYRCRFGIDTEIVPWGCFNGVPVPEGQAHLYDPIRPPMAPAYIDWRWPNDQQHFSELVTEFTIHNDVGNWSNRYGYYLILTQNYISDTGFYFGLQTNANGRGKAVIFSRWGTRDLANARWSEADGWTESSGHEGDFIGVRRSYPWSASNYQIRMGPDGLDSDGQWFGLWITDLATGVTTWIGSLKFPLLNGTAAMQPYSSATIELYGGYEPIRPIEIPQWQVSVKRPWGDGVQSTWGYTSYPWDDSENALFNSDVWYDPSEDAAHLLVGGTTERKTAAGRVDFSSG